MRIQITRITGPFILALALSVSAAPLMAQGRGKGQEKGHDKARPGKVHASQGGQKPGNAKAHANKPQSGRERAAASKQGRGAATARAHGNSGNARAHARGNDHKDNGSWKAVRRADLNRGATRLVSTRVANTVLLRANDRGRSDDDFRVLRLDDRVRIANRNNVVLVDLDDDGIRNLGRWDVRPVVYRDNGGAPAFCRSGAGHPVWGRQWCIEKGFGLGYNDDIRWGYTRLDNVLIRPVSTGSLLRDALISAVGNVVFDRLGLHAVTLGYTEPLSGVWIGEPTGPRVLRVSSGAYPVAEIVDLNRDNNADLLVVAVRR